MKADEFEAVKEVLMDLLATTADDELWLQLSPDEVAELQAALWQCLADHDDMERQLRTIHLLSRREVSTE